MWRGSYANMNSYLSSILHAISCEIDSLQEATPAFRLVVYENHDVGYTCEKAKPKLS